MKSQTSQIKGREANHHRLLYESLPATNQPTIAAHLVVDGDTYPSLTAREGAFSTVASQEGEGGPATQAMMTCNSGHLNEAYSLSTIPVWVKARGKKIKLNAILDDA